MARYGLWMVVAGLFASAPAPAQNYPVKTVRLIVPFPPGGSTETLARMLSVRLAQVWGQQIIIDNRPGAGGVIGTELGAKAVADGYTLLMGSGAPLTIVPGLQTKLAYDPLKDFAPIVMVAAVPNVIALHPSVPARDVKSLIALARARPDQLTFSSNGTGAPGHLAGELLNTMAQVRMLHVPYKGSGEVIPDLVANRVAMYMAPYNAVSGHMKDGRLIALGAGGARRATLLPELPTLAEQGVTGYGLNVWFGLWVPSGTPAAIVQRLNAEVTKAVAAPDVLEQFTKLGLEAQPMTPEAFAKFVRDDIATNQRIVSEARIERQ